MTRGRARRFLVCDRGVTAVEFAFVMPAFLALALAFSRDRTPAPPKKTLSATSALAFGLRQKPMRRPVHQLFRERSPAERLAARWRASRQMTFFAFLTTDPNAIGLRTGFSRLSRETRPRRPLDDHRRTEAEEGPAVH